MSDLDEKDIKKIVADEVKKYMSNELDKRMKAELSNKNSLSRDVMITAIRNAILELAKFLWLQKQTYINNIK